MLNQALAPKLKGLELPTALPRDKKQTPPAKIAFPYKLYKLLDDAERAGIHSSIISWLPDGSGFKIHDAKAFSDTVMSSYFNQSKYKSFTRQCKLLSEDVMEAGVGGVAGVKPTNDYTFILTTSFSLLQYIFMGF